MIILRLIIYIIVFFISIIYFLPKNELVDFAMSKYGSKFEIELNAKLENKYLSYISNNAKVDYKNQNVLKIEDIKIDPFLAFNKIEGKNIQLQGMPAAFFPKNIKNAKAIYSVMEPKKVLLSANGDFGKMTGYFDLINFKIYLEVIPSSIMKSQYSFVLNNLRKTPKNYVYEFKL